MHLEVKAKTALDEIGVPRLGSPHHPILEMLSLHASHCFSPAVPRGVQHCRGIPTLKQSDNLPIRSDQKQQTLRELFAVGFVIL